MDQLELTISETTYMLQRGIGMVMLTLPAEVLPNSSAADDQDYRLVDPENAKIIALRESLQRSEGQRVRITVVCKENGSSGWLNLATGLFKYNTGSSKAAPIPKTVLAIEP